MTVSSTTNKTTILGDGVTSSFQFSFIGINAAYISVIYTDAQGDITTLSPSLYTLALNAAAPGQIWGYGGTVTYPLVGSPIAVGTSLTIVRTLPYEQTTSLTNQGAQFPQSTEQGLDVLEMQIQQVEEQFGRSLVAPVSDPAGVDYTLPSVAQRANTGLIFDSQGNVAAGSTPASGVISTAMQPVVDAASLAAGRAAFGLGALSVEGFGPGLSDDGAGNARVGITKIFADATNQNVDATYAFTTRVVGATIVYTINRANTLWNGFCFSINAASGIATVTPNAADNFFGLSSGASITIPQGYSAFIYTNAATTGVWYVQLTAPLLVTPVGSIDDFPCTTAPAGYLPLSGQLVSRATYPNLWAFAALSGNIQSDAAWVGSAPAFDGAFSSGDGATTFRLPDPRGDFARSWDNGRGVDSGRAIGTEQGDSVGPHTHSSTTGGGSLVANSSVNPYSGNSANSTGAVNSGRTSGENRPRNVAWLTCIKY